MDREKKAQVVESIQSCGRKACLVITGGGSGAAHAILSHAGASRFVLDVQIPYSDPALVEYAGAVAGSACSEETARKMAHAAHRRAMRLTDAADPLGIACTAALQTTRERRGDDRAFVCIRSMDRELVKRIDFSVGSREVQEAELVEQILLFISDFLGIRHDL